MTDFLSFDNVASFRAVVLVCFYFKHVWNFSFFNQIGPDFKKHIGGQAFIWSSKLNEFGLIIVLKRGHNELTRGDVYMYSGLNDDGGKLAKQNSLLSWLLRTEFYAGVIPCDVIMYLVYYIFSIIFSLQKKLPADFKTKQGWTYMHDGNKWVMYGDFALKLLGKIPGSGNWVCSCAASMLGKIQERWAYVIPNSIKPFCTHT